MIKYIILYLCFISSISASPFKDGVWNGKPWKKSHLLAEVEKGNPDALAEWACCSNYVYLDISYDIELILDRLRIATEKGSLLAKAFYANMLYSRSNEELKAQGIKMMDEAYKEGHPLAIAAVGRRHLFGLNAEKDFDKAYTLLKEGEKYNCRLAIGVLSYFYQYDRRNNTRYDIPKSISLRKILIENYRGVYSAINLNRMFKDRAFRKYYHLIDVDTLNKGDLLIADAASLNLPFAMTHEAEIQLKQGNHHIGLPMMIRAANIDNGPALAQVIQWFKKGYKIKSEGKEQLMAKAPYSDTLKLSGLSFNTGNQTNETLRTYAKFLFHKKDGTPEKLKQSKKKAEDLLLSKLNFKKNVHYDCNCHDALADGLMINHFNSKEPLNKKLVQRAVAHYIYHSDHTSRNIYWIAWYKLNDKNSKTYDPVKGMAAAKSSLNMIDNTYKDQAKKLINKSKKDMTAEQNTQIEALFKDGYPGAEKHRREAYKYLLSIGDISPKHKFRPNE